MLRKVLHFVKGQQFQNEVNKKGHNFRKKPTISKKFIILETGQQFRKRSIILKKGQQFRKNGQDL